MAGGAGEAERGEFVREVAVLACIEVNFGFCSDTSSLALYTIIDMIVYHCHPICQNYQKNIFRIPI